jgi:RNA polymerase-binding transcription factor DksA
MYKQNFEEILENVQQQILNHFDLTEEELEAATEAYKDDPDIAKQVAELESLYLGMYVRRCKKEGGVILMCD